MLASTPSELVFGGVYYPPALLIGLLGLIAAWIAAKLLNRTRLARFFWYPALAFVAMWALFSALIGLLFLAP
ncbi:MAG: DUF1656 domain-containing protein [Planctomycetes bacterium]|nr:DUF1656 domain-containing protein [Planctomycetota bacterium]